MDRHRLAELRSLAYHRAVADLARDDDSVVARARERVGGWQGPAFAGHCSYAERWALLLLVPLDELCAALTRDDEEMRAMRQCTPFAGALDPRERWRIWREVAEGAVHAA